MKSWGVGLLCLGIAVLIGSLFMPTSVPIERMTALSSLDIKIGSGVYDQVFNLQRAYNRSLVFESGWFLILGGLVMIAGGAVLERIAAIGAVDAADGGAAEAKPTPAVAPDDIAARAAANAWAEKPERAAADPVPIWAIVLAIGVLAFCIALAVYGMAANS